MKCKQKKMNSNPILIGLVGKKGVGKSTVSKFLNQSERNFVECAFSDALKKILQTLFFLNSTQLYGSQKDIIDEKLDVSPRQLMQIVGTQLFRNHLREHLPELKLNINESLEQNLNEDRSVWIWHLEKRIIELMQCTRNVIVSDVRFENEVHCIKRLGGIIIHIHRPSLVSEDTHSSEMLSIPNEDVDYEIINDGNLEDLRNNVKKIISQIFK